MAAISQPAADPRLRLLPIRHHSPRCAYHLRELIGEFRPDLVLIEGPQELNALLPALCHPQAAPPLAGYLHTQGSGAAQALRYRCYVPFADYSPEWVALREAARLGIAVQFMDLPYGERVARAASPQYFVESPEPQLNDDALLRPPRILERLLADSGCRDFDEWWDRHFESGARPADAETYFRSVLRFSEMLRIGDDGTDAENQAREAHMAACIGAALAQDQRCLAVCGGYHVPGILAALDAAEPAPRISAAPAEAHLIGYSLARLDRASGYAAGMPAPGYYQQVWRHWQAQAPLPYRAAFAPLAARLAVGLRQDGLAASLPDAREAVAMAERLAALRGCHGGRSELSEALRSTLLKEIDASGLFERRLHAVLAGDAQGRLPPNAPMAPLVHDFQAFCRRHRLPLRLSGRKRRELDLYRSATHRQLSHGLHRLRFLEIPYADRLAGPDFVHGQDLGRVRELWELNWRSETEAMLTEAARYGASLEEAALNRVLEQLRQPGTRNPATLVLEVLVMGLHAVAGVVLERVGAWLDRSYDALALAEAASRLATAYEARETLAARGFEALEPLLEKAFRQACTRLPWLGEGDDELSEAAVEALADLNGMLQRGCAWADAPSFHQACAALYAQTDDAPVRGAAAAILTVSRHWPSSSAERALSRELGRARVDPVAMGRFLQGFLRIARGWLLTSPHWLTRMSEQLTAWSEEDFLNGLPSLRLAFSQLTRAELRALAERIAGKDAAFDPADTPALSPEQLRHSAQQAALVEALLRRWGLHD